MAAIETGSRDTINSAQMAVLFFTFLTGSSIINTPSPLIAAAGSGAWLSLLLSGTGGFAVLAVVLYLHRRFPGLTYIEYSRKLIGSWATAFTALLALLFMIQMGTGIVLDVAIFMKSSMMREAPTYIFTSLIYLVAALTVYAGLEVMSRMFILLTTTTMLFNVLVLLLATPDYHPQFLMPVMPHGIKPVLHGGYMTFGFPYVEIFLFAMLLPAVGKNEKRRKLSRYLYTALCLNIAVLTVSTLCTIMVFGPLAGERKYSLFEVARTVDVQEIIQRIESIIGMSLITGSYMKVSVTIFAINLLLVRLLKLQDSRLLVFPLALLLMLMTISSVRSITQWTEIVSTIHPLWGGLSFLVTLGLCFVAALIRRKRIPADS